MLRSKSMSRSQYLHSLCKVFVSVLSGGNVLILFLKQVGGRNTVLERAFVRNGVPFVSEVPIIIFGADVTHRHQERTLHHPLLLLVSSHNCQFPNHYSVVWSDLTMWYSCCYLVLVMMPLYLFLNLCRWWHQWTGQKSPSTVVWFLLNHNNKR